MPNGAPRSPARRWPRGAAAAVALAGCATVGAAALLARWLGDGALVLRAAALVVARRRRCLLWLAARQLAAETFGAANSVTLVRAALAVLLVALLGAAPAPALGWMLVGLGAAGRGARRRRRRARARPQRGERLRRAVRHGDRRVADPRARGARLAARQSRARGSSRRACCAICSSRRAGPCRGSARRCRRAGAAKPSASCRSCRCSVRSRPSSCRRGAPRWRSRGSRRSSGRSPSTSIGSRGARAREAAMTQAAPLSARQWAALAVALLVLNAALTFQQRLADALDRCRAPSSRSSSPCCCSRSSRGRRSCGRSERRRASR